MTATITIDTIIAEYAGRIAAAFDLDLTPDNRTPDGFTALLETAADRLSSLDHTADWLREAASDLDAYNRLGGDDDKSRKLLRTVNSLLYEAVSDLELSQ